MSNISKRSQILTTIRDLYKAVAAGAPVGDPFPFAFSRAELGPIAYGADAKQYTVGIVAGDETKRDLFPFKEATLPIAIEFQRVKQKGEASTAEMAEEMLTVVQRVVNEASTAGTTNTLNLDFVVDVRETGNHVDLDSFADKAIAGVLYIEVQYRHSRYDTRT
jgi:hypothetical protein